ncbi:MAG: aminotransferase class I/II-fold pyridoxal phosphate-dependent enzyme [Candidatus Delongbacteria bacterium]|jgi:dTDP-4-amino-4,6-dideoxygalactose transaminase|nr:aminotransferase class I/II-fold pyridoxal phosphate-dependent enzyme [Candidatus Delongbacteria bacterium]
MKENKRIWLASPNMGGSELDYINEAFETNWVAPVGPHIDGFEKEMCEYLSIKSSVALSCGTAAIHLALILLGVKTDDEVLCQSFTFSATANPIAYQGAKPIFVDSEKETWNMDPVLLEKAINDRVIKVGQKPKAVIVVHLYGQSAKIDKIQEICKKYDIPLIEDAAEGLGSSFEGKKLGNFGDIGILSFNGNKIITTSSGGMMISNNENYISKARFLATQARDDAPHYEHSHIGYNYRMSNILAGIGRGQLQILDKRVEQKREIFKRYSEAFKNIDGIEFQPEIKDSISNKWLTAITIDPDKTGFTREDIRLELQKHNIESRPLWKPMHLQPIFKDCISYTNGVSEELFKIGLCLPSDTNMTKEDQERVIEIIVGNAGMRS